MLTYVTYMERGTSFIAVVKERRPLKFNATFLMQHNSELAPTKASWARFGQFGLVWVRLGRFGLDLVGLCRVGLGRLGGCRSVEHRRKWVTGGQGG